MAKRELTGNGGNAGPTVKITDKAGTKFVGVLKGKAPSRFGARYIFNILDTNAPITLKEGESLKEVEVAENDEVSVFASGQLDEKLSKAENGEKIEINFLGKKLNPKSGRYYNDFKADVIE